MSVRLIFDGLDDFKEGLRNLPHELAVKAGHIVEATAQQMGQELQSNYPSKTGNLRRGVRVTVNASTVSTQGIVKSTAPHAHLFEHGTARRTTRHGANRGVMPKGQSESLVGPRAGRLRRRMTEQLIAIVREAGLDVSQS